MIPHAFSFISEEWLSPAITIVAKSSVLLLLMWMACWLLRHRSAALRHRLWTFALTGCIAVPAVAMIGPQLRIPLLRANPIEQEVKTILASKVNIAECCEAGSGNAGTKPTLFSGDSNAALLSESIAAFSCPVAESLTSGGATAKATDNSAIVTDVGWQKWLLAIWIVGFLYLISRLCIALLLQQRQMREMNSIDDAVWTSSVAAIAKQLGVTRSHSTFQSATVTVPMTYGVFSAVIVVPTDWPKWSDEHRHCVLSHELAHVQRYDVATQMFARVIAAVYWFNPLIWFAVYRMRVEREFACDDAVLLSGRRSSEYADALLTTLRNYRRQRFDLGVAMADSARLDRRVEAILDNTRRRHSPGRAMTYILIAMTVCCASMIGAAKLTTVVIQPQQASVEVDPEISVQRARTVAGTVRDAVSGEPVENAEVYVLGGNLEYTKRQDSVRTDRQGRYRLVRSDQQGELTIVVDGDKHVYLPMSRTFKNGADGGEITADFTISHGVQIRGKVVEENTDRPIASEHRDFCDDVQPGPLYAGYAKYYPLKENRWLKDLGEGLVSIPFQSSQENFLRRVHIDANGEFHMSVPRGRGIILIEAHPPRDTLMRYANGTVPKVPYLTLGGDITGTKSLMANPKPSQTSFPGMLKPIEADNFHTYKLIDPANDSDPLNLRFEVKLPPTQRIHFVDPNGHPISGVNVAGLMPRGENGQFQVTNVLDSDAVAYLEVQNATPRRIVAISDDGKSGVSTSITAITESPLTIKMQPTALLKFRLVDKTTGKPPVGYLFSLIYGKGVTSTQGLSIDSTEEFTRDKKGEITVTSIIPGEPVSLVVIPPQALRAKPQELEPVTLAPGEVKDLGNMEVE